MPGVAPAAMTRAGPGPMRLSNTPQRALVLLAQVGAPGHLLPMGRRRSKRSAAVYSHRPATAHHIVSGTYFRRPAAGGYPANLVDQRVIEERVASVEALEGDPLASVDSIRVRNLRLPTLRTLS